MSAQIITFPCKKVRKLYDSSGNLALEETILGEIILSRVVHDPALYLPTAKSYLEEITFLDRQNRTIKVSRRTIIVTKLSKEL